MGLRWDMSAANWEAARNRQLVAEGIRQNWENVGTMLGEGASALHKALGPKQKGYRRYLSDLKQENLNLPEEEQRKAFTYNEWKANPEEQESFKTYREENPGLFKKVGAKVGTAFRNNPLAKALERGRVKRQDERHAKEQGEYDSDYNVSYDPNITGPGVSVEDSSIDPSIKPNPLAVALSNNYRATPVGTNAQNILTGTQLGNLKGDTLVKGHKRYAGEGEYINPKDPLSHILRRDTYQNYLPKPEPVSRIEQATQPAYGQEEADPLNQGYGNLGQYQYRDYPSNPLANPAIRRRFPWQI